MKRRCLLSLGVLLLTGAVFAWQQTTQTSWSGFEHMTSQTTFTPSSTTAHVTESSPDLGSIGWCPVDEEEPPFCFNYKSRARLFRGGLTYVAEKDCGGCAYYRNASVTTNETWTIEASIVQICGTEIQAQGPVKATAANPQVNCGQE